jgi:hypothetical protein
MASTEIAFCIYNLIIIIVSPDIHGYVYYMFFAKLLQEMYCENCFWDVAIVPVCLTSVVLCFYFIFLRLVCPVRVLPVSLEFPILISPSCTCIL